MTRRTPIGQRPRASRIDDLGATDISVSPETWCFEHAAPRAAPVAAPLRTQAPMR